MPPADAPPPLRPAARVALALLWGALCHGLFALGVGIMVWAMWHGMSRSPGPFEGWAAVLANLLLIAQFPLGHSALLSRPGRAALARLAPAGAGRTLAPTTYAIVASVQIGLLFGLWSPSGIVWWQAEGALLAPFALAYAASFGLLGLASLQAGAELQSGMLGWRALIENRAPRYPDLPQTGLFRRIRQPIYLAFALTTWTVPTWTPDQLALALGLTAYCLFGPRLKERRMEAIHGDRWRAYRDRTPFWIPRAGQRRRAAR